MTERSQLRLEPRTDAAGEARTLTAEACRAWHLSPVRPRAELIVAELVGNAVRHAGTGVLVTLTRRGAGVHLAVNDDDPRLPALPEPAPRDRATADDARHGLRAVHAAATVWGAMPTSNGKVVWALVRPGP